MGVRILKQVKVVTHLMIAYLNVLFHFLPINGFLSGLLAQNVELADVLVYVTDRFYVVHVNVEGIPIIASVPDFGDALLDVVEIHAINKD